MSVYFYDPFYDLDRFLEDGFVPRSGSNNNGAVQRRDNSLSNDGAVRPLRPR